MASTPPAATAKASTPPATPEKAATLEKLDIVAKLAISAAGVFLSAAIGYATLRYNQEAGLRQVQSQKEAMALQRRNVAAQLLVSHFPTVLRGDERERALMLDILSQVDPDLVREIGKTLLDQANKTGADPSEAKAIIASSREVSRQLELSQHLETASKYRDLGLYPSAAREYLRAIELLPLSEARRLEEPLRRGRQLYGGNEFEAAVRVFEKAMHETSSRAARDQL